MLRIASVISAAASGWASCRMLAAIGLAARSSHEQRREMFDERVAERLLERRFVDDRRGAGGGDDVGIGELIGFDVARIGHEHRRHAGERQLGERRAAGTADDQIAGEHHGRHFVDERDGQRVDAGVAVAVDRLLQLAFARSGGRSASRRSCVAKSLQRPRHVFVDAPRTVGAADHDEPPYAAVHGRRDSLLGSFVAACMSRYIRSNAGRAGLPVITSGVSGEKWARTSSKPQQTTSAERASQRVTWLGTAFCSSSTVGMSRECGGPHGGGAGIAAQADDERRAVFFEIPARGPVAGDVVGDEPHRQERISRHGLRGDRDVVEAGGPHRDGVRSACRRRRR